MKKLTFLILISLLLVGCNSNVGIETNIELENISTNAGITLDESIKTEKIPIENKKLTELKDKFNNLIEYIEYNEDSEFVINELNSYFDNMNNNLISKKAISKLDINLCSIISNNFLVNECKTKVILEKSKTTGNDSLCNNEFENNFEISDCKNNINLFLSKEKNDILFCEKIESENDEYKNNCKNEFYYNEAKKLQDIKICNKITDKNFIDSCKQEVNMFIN